MRESTKSRRGSAAASGLGRRSLLLMTTAAIVSARHHALADTAQENATVTIERFNAALLVAMKTGEQAAFANRFAALAPSVEQAFELATILRVSVGASWPNLMPEQQVRLLDAFRRYTVASYVANFSKYSGQSFIVLPETRGLDGDRIVVQSRLVSAHDSAVEFDYVMQRTALNWKIVDVLAGGSISRVAVQRSDFRRLLSNGGGDALLVSLRHKTIDLAGGAMV